jgi:RNA polymerase sigma-70 factor (ECF subfamily)
LEFSLPINELERAAAEAAERSMTLDEQQFRLLYERTAKPLWAYLARVSRDRAAADDLLQEVYHRFLRAKLPEMDHQGLKNYLFKIATNLLRDRRRTLRNETELTDAPAPDRPAAGVEARTDLERAMESLAERERQLVWMAYAEGFSHREIAETMGLKERSVRPLLHRAKMQLVDALERRAPWRPGGARPT